MYYGELGANIMAAAYGGSDRDRLMVRICKLIFIVYFIYITIVFENKMMKWKTNHTTLSEQF